MTVIQQKLRQLPPNIRYALIRELQALNGHQPDMLANPSEESMLAALAGLIDENRPKRRRVVITGIGAITPVGNTAPATWEALLAGRSGVTRVTQFDISPYPTQIGAEIKGFDPTLRIPPKEARRMARCSQVSVVAAYEAMEDSGLNLNGVDHARMGVIMGTGLGGIDLYSDMMRRAAHVAGAAIRGRPLESINGLANMPAFHISQAFSCQGPLATVVTACAASTQAIGHATEEIRRGAADVMLAGGVEALIIDLLYAGFTAMRAISTRNDEPERASRPFDATRDGFIIGEGSTVFVLESLENALARGARIYAEVLGWSETADAYHIAQPDPEGNGAARAMWAALEDARLSTDDISYINAHAAGTPLGDAAETRAIKKVFGEQAYNIPISSTKSMIGHLFGGAGATEALACVYAIHSDAIHPTINYENPDPDCDLDYVPNVARQATVNVALSNSFGLGGQNACLIVGKYPAQA